MSNRIWLKENMKEHNLNSPYIPDQPSRILLIKGSVLGKSNVLFNLLGQQAYIKKIIYMLRIHIKQKPWFYSFFECSNDVDDIYENIED